MTEMSDTWNTPLPVCPWCGYKEEVACHYAEMEDGETTDQRCDECGKLFRVKASVTRCCTTDQVREY